MFFCLCHALGYNFFPSSLACHVYFMLCSIFLDVFVFHLSFIFSFILHPSCIIFYHCSYLLFFSSFLLICLSIHDKKGESAREYTGVYHHFYMTHVYILRVRNSTSCTFIGGKSHRGDAYTKGGKTSFYEKALFCLPYILLLFLLLYGAFSTFSIYTLLLFSHRVYVLDMHTSLCYCALLVVCLDDHLLYYMIILVISI